jgi:hypothetical protein
MIEWLTAKPGRNATVEWLHASSTRAQRMLNWRAIRLIAQVSLTQKFGITAKGLSDRALSTEAARRRMKCCLSLF